MSILIKGMEMPKSRGEYELRMYVHSDGTATAEGAYSLLKGEPFEIIPVPPHGRLIDADAVVEVVRCRDCRSWSKNSPEDGYGWCLNSVVGSIESSENFFCALGARKEEEGE